MKNGSQTGPAVALGGSLAVGITTMLIGGYKIADCIRYQSGPGQCNQVIEDSLPTVIGGASTLFAGWGGFNTYNSKLRKDDEEFSGSQSKLTIDKPEKEKNKNMNDEIDPMLIREFYKNGATQNETAMHFGVSRHYVQKALKQTKNRDRGR